MPQVNRCHHCGSFLHHMGFDAMGVVVRKCSGILTTRDPDTKANRMIPCGKTYLDVCNKLVEVEHVIW